MLIIVLFNILLFSCSPTSLTDSETLEATTENNCSGDDNPIPPPPPPVG